MQPLVERANTLQAMLAPKTPRTLAPPADRSKHDALDAVLKEMEEKQDAMDMAYATGRAFEVEALLPQIEQLRQRANTLLREVEGRPTKRIRGKGRASSNPFNYTDLEGSFLEGQAEAVRRVSSRPPRGAPR